MEPPTDAAATDTDSPDDKTILAAIVDTGGGDGLAVTALADFARIPEPAAVLRRPIHA